MTDDSHRFIQKLKKRELEKDAFRRAGIYVDDLFRESRGGNREEIIGKLKEELEKSG